jgi:hypothetical protein
VVETIVVAFTLAAVMSATGILTVLICSASASLGRNVQCFKPLIVDFV